MILVIDMIVHDGLTMIYNNQLNLITLGVLNG